jgi:uncharacterized protein (TIGR02147 family)
MLNIFNYQDYRRFLADYYAEQKAMLGRSFSYQNFSRKAGFTSKSFVFNVIKGRKNLSSSSIITMAEALKLNKTEAAYFEYLVSFNQATTFKARSFFFEQLNSIRPATAEASTAKKLRQDQFEFYATWYNLAIRSLIDLVPFNGDAKWISQMVYPPITPRQAADSVKLLERLGLIVKGKDGFYKVTDKMLTTGSEVQSLAVQHFHIENMRLAQNAIQALALDQRNVSGLTLGISAQAYGQICAILGECQQKIMAVAEKDARADGVYQLNFHLFPLTKPRNKGAAHE